jgi:transmembrane sensor
MSLGKATESSYGREPSPTEKAALARFSLRNRGLTPEQELEFEAWLAEDPAHREILDELEGVFQLVGEFNENPLIGVGEVGETESVWAASTKFHRLKIAWILGSLAAAAALTFAYLGSLHPAYYSASGSTDIGEMRVMILPDGSKVELNTETAVSVSYTRAERRVRLERGEAFFAVAKNPDLLFVVEVAGVAVRAVGTAFDVRLDSEAVKVLVTDGRVQVEKSGSRGSLLPAAVHPTDAAPVQPGLKPAEPLLAAGQRAVIPVLPKSLESSPDSQPVQVTWVVPDEIQRELAWQKHRIEFAAAPLSEMVVEFNRYNRHKLVIGDEHIASMRYGGSFRSDDYAGFVRMLQKNFSVKVEERDGQTVLKLAR